MLFPAKTRSILFVVFAVVLFLAAVYHMAGIFYKVNNMPGWRHLLFVVIDLFFVYGALKRPKYFAWLVALFVAQQYYSHGTYLIDMWIEKKQIHWFSVFDLLLCPIGLICVVEDYKMKYK